MIDDAICGVLLGAGGSARFGTDKLFATGPQGVSMAVASARTIRGALGSVSVVLRPQQAALQALFRREPGVRIVECREAVLGMGHSLARGVDACRKASGWLIALADMPCIEVATVRRIAAALDQPEAIVVPVYDGRRGHPVAFGSAYGETLTALTGDRGARGLLDRHRERVRELACGDPGIVFDIDTQEDIDEWRARMGSLQKK